MAPYTFNSTDVELHEPEVAKPSPLRIIKRSQTISGSSSGGETFGGRRGTSGESRESMGTPPGGDRPLTVRKKRTTRASVSDWGLDEPLSEMTPENLNKLNSLWKINGQPSPQGDPDLTPKAKVDLPRTISAGAFLKSEFHRQSLDIEEGTNSVRGQRHSLCPRDEDLRRHPCTHAQNWSPTIPQRRPSKSKNFFLRAFGGRNSEETKSIKRNNSTLSKNTLVRRRSRIKKKVSASYDASYEDNISSVGTESCYPSESFDIVDVGINSRTSCETPLSYSASDTTSIIASDNNFVLCPQILVTPEVASVENGNCDLWVAVEITGVLHRADGHEVTPLISRPNSFDAKHYGKLHSMEIELCPGRDCQVADVIGNLHRIPTIKAYETHLVLAKVLLGRVASSRHVREASCADLIAQLEADLGDNTSPYLTVRVTYQHSGFPNHESTSINNKGLSSHFTRLQTEAKAVIRRHNSQSAWSPRTSQTIVTPLESNPLVKLIEMHFPSDKARESLKRLADERAPIPMANNMQQLHLPSSSEETVNPGVKPVTSSFAAAVDLAFASPPVSHRPVTVSPAVLSGPFARLPQAHLSQERASSDVIDPARKIWTEMRRNSRGGRSRHPRTSISADHYYSLEEEAGPSRISSGETSVSTNPSVFGGKRKPGDIERERSRIMEVALRNKRSVGAETLRSMAPSVVQMGPSTVGNGKRGAFGGLGGVGLGRTWGWGPPWW